jgi:drug/metabolite transporter (DMT)-like permease
VNVKQAIKFMIVSALAFTFMNLTVKYLIHMSAAQIVFFRSAGSLFFTFGILIPKNINIIGNNPKLLVLRGLFGVVAMSLFFESMKYLPTGTAVSLRYLSPIFAAVLAVFILKEKVKPIQWLLFIVAFSGVLILRGFDSSISTYGLFIILLAAVFSGLVYIVISKIGTSEHPVVVVNYFMMIATIVGGILSINNWIHPVGIEWILLLSLGIYGYIGQLYMTKAFQIAKANQVAPFKYIEVVFTLLLGVFFFAEIYSIWSIIGIVLIVSALILNVLYSQKQQ